VHQEKAIEQTLRDMEEREQQISKMLAVIILKL
jgi:hypothetical protein